MLRVSGGRLSYPHRQGFGSVEGEQPPVLRIGVQGVDEPGFHPCGLVAEGQRPQRRGIHRRQAGAVLVGLEHHPGERVPHRLRLNRPDRLATDEQDVIGPPMIGFEHHLTDRHSGTSSEIHLVRILHHPAAGNQPLIDVAAGSLFSRDVVGVGHSRVRLQPPSRRPHPKSLLKSIPSPRECFMVRVQGEMPNRVTRDPQLSERINSEGHDLECVRIDCEGVLVECTMVGRTER